MVRALFFILIVFVSCGKSLYKGYRFHEKGYKKNNQYSNNNDTLIIIYPVGIGYSDFFNNRDYTISKPLFDSVASLFSMQLSNQLDSMNILHKIEKLDLVENELRKLENVIIKYNKGRISADSLYSHFPQKYKTCVLFFLSYVNVMMIGSGTGYGSGSLRHHLEVHSRMFYVENSSIKYNIYLYKSERVKPKKPVELDIKEFARLQTERVFLQVDVQSEKR